MTIHRAYFQHPEYSLRLDYAHLTTLPKQLWARTDWRALSLVGNQLTQLDTRIGQLTELRALDVSGNALTTLPSSLVQLQQLEALVLSNNQFAVFPEVLCQLPNLRWLLLKGNQLTELPATISQLQRLCILDLSFNPLQQLPQALAQLPELTNLLCASNQFAVFPEVLLQMPQLQQPEHLDLQFRLRLPTAGLNQLFGLLRQAKRQRIALPARRVLFALLFDRPLQAAQQSDAIALLPLNANRALRRPLHAFLTALAQPLGPKSRIGVVGQLQQLEWDWLLQQPWYTEDWTQVTHVLLGRQPKKTHLQQVPSTVSWVVEHQVQAFWAPLKRVDWLETERDQLKALLLSGQEQPIALVVQWMEGATLVRELAHELLLAYTTLPVAARALRQQIQQLFTCAFPQFEPQHLPHPAFVFYKRATTSTKYPYQTNKSESNLTKRLIQYTHEVVYWEGTVLAQLIFERTGAGYDYLMRFLPKTALQLWLRQFVQGEDTLCFSALKAMQALPRLEATHWTSIRRLDLRGCTFRRAPDLQLLQQLPQLEEIDLRHNPIRHLPRATLAQFAAYRIFISK